MIKPIIMLLIAIQFVWEQFLTWLNIRYISRNSSKLDLILPDFLKPHINRKDYEKAVKYSKANASFGFVEDIFHLIVILLVLGFSLLNPIDEWTKDLPLNRVVFCLIILLIANIVSIPFRIYRVFVIEERFGFNKTTPGLFVKDLIKGLLISVIISTILLWSLFYLYDITGEYWWLWAFLLFTLFQIIMQILYPLIIAPLFNKFKPLEEGELLEEIRELTGRIQFPLKGVFVMDGSKRSSHTNAYFAGIGKAKRIVLFDTLIEKLSIKELVAVLAHELGHYKLHHVKIYLLISSFFSLVGFYLLNLVLHSSRFFMAMGYDQPQVHIGLILLAFILPVLDMVFGPLFNMLARWNEYQSDRFSINAVKDKSSLASSLIKLNKDNLSNPLPHPIYSFIHYSHPPLAERLKAIESIELPDRLKSI